MLDSADVGKLWHRRLSRLSKNTVDFAITKQEENYGKLASEDQNEGDICPQTSLSEKPFKGTLAWTAFSPRGQNWIRHPFRPRWSTQDVDATRREIRRSVH